MGSVRGVDGQRVSLQYRGHLIEAICLQEGWRGVLDENVETAAAFGSSEEAQAWLRRRVDDFIAERLCPGLTQYSNVALLRRP